MIANAAGGTATVITPAAAWKLMRMHNLRMMLTAAARAQGVRLDDVTLDVLAVLDDAAEAYRPAVGPSGHSGPSADVPTGNLIPTNETATRLQVTDRQVRRLIQQRQLTAVRQSGRLMVDENSIVELLEARVKGAA